MKTFLLTSLVLSLLGCTTVEYIYPKIDVPPVPVLPLISREQVECLTIETRTDMIVREEVIWGYVEELRALIEAHNSEE